MVSKEVKRILLWRKVFTLLGKGFFDVLKGREFLLETSDFNVKVQKEKKY